MDLWRWFVGLFRKSRPERMAGDNDRYYEPSIGASATRRRRRGKGGRVRGLVAAAAVGVIRPTARESG